MKNHYLQTSKRVWLALLWIGLIGSQTTWAQSIPDVQWSQPGKTLAVTTDGNIVVTDGLPQAIKYDPQGNKAWQSGLLRGTTFLGIGTQPPGSPLNGYSYLTNILLTTPAQDGGIALIGVEFSTLNKVFTKINASGTQGVTGLINYELFDQNPDPGVSSQITLEDLIGTPDGGFLLLVTSAEPNAKTVAYVQKVDANLSPSWTKQIAYPTPNPATPDRSLTKGETVINTPDGGYLVAGYYNTTGQISDLNADLSINNTGWVAKLDGQGNVSWQKLLDNLPRSANINGPAPGSIYRMNYVTDAILAADGNGYALVGSGTILSAMVVAPATLSVLELNQDGSFKRARSTGVRASEAFISPYTNGGGPPFYAVGSTSFENGTDPQILKINAATLSLNDPVLLGVVAKRTFDRSPDSFLQGIGRAGDGALVFITTNEVIKLNAEPLPLGLSPRPPTYNCQTGAITFNTSGGDGSPITFIAPGVTRASATDNFGIVESGLRNDPKVIPITAIQSGGSATFYFDLKAVCNNTLTPQPPVLNQPIPDQYLTVGQSLSGNGFIVGSYFTDPTVNVPNYVPNWSFIVSGLPDGLYPFSRPTDLMFLPAITILGTPTTAGIYTVTVTARTAAFSSSPVTTTFKFIVSTTPQPGGTLSMSQPTYNCQTGAISFNTSGGDGSPVTYIAPGISRSSATANSGTVEQGLRNDPKPITIQAIQNGQTATFVFDFGAYCQNPPPPQPPTGGSLVLLAPTYNCTTGAIHFNTSGGNGTTIEFQAIGITGWTSNPDQFVDKESRTASDVKPFMLMARQNGQVVTYVWDLKAACGRARIGVSELPSELTVQLLGNPVDDLVKFDITGAENQRLQMQLIDMRGRTIGTKVIDQATTVEHQSFDVHAQGPGILILSISSEGQTQRIKVLKH